jgi:hypothetical protein
LWIQILQFQLSKQTKFLIGSEIDFPNESWGITRLISDKLIPSSLIDFGNQTPSHSLFEWCGVITHDVYVSCII